jgi:hypothetical protein
MLNQTIEKVNFTQIVTILILGISWTLYLKWYSVFKDRTKKILKEGNQLPPI